MSPMLFFVITGVLTIVLAIFIAPDTTSFFYDKSRRTKIRKVSTVLVILCFFVLNVVMMFLFCSNREETDVIKNEKTETQQIASLTQVGPKKYLLQDGASLQYDVYAPGKRRSQEAPIENASVYYDTNNAGAHVVIKETLVERQTKFLFLSEKDTISMKEYEFHIPSYNNIIFSFEKD